jgi:hypothetical protein
MATNFRTDIAENKETAEKQTEKNLGNYHGKNSFVRSRNWQD